MNKVVVVAHMLAIKMKEAERSERNRNCENETILRRENEPAERKKDVVMGNK